MDAVHVDQVAMRWLHIAAAIVAVGGAFFLRVVLLPGMSSLEESQRATLRAATMRRWAMVLRVCMALLLLSGFYNYIVVLRPRHVGQAAYHGLIGSKIVLAFVVFAIADGLVGRAPAFEFIRRRPAVWLTINLLLAAIIVAVSNTLRYMRTTG